MTPSVKSKSIRLGRNLADVFRAYDPVFFRIFLLMLAVMLLIAAAKYPWTVPAMALSYSRYLNKRKPDEVCRCGCHSRQSEVACLAELRKQLLACEAKVVWKEEKAQRDNPSRHVRGR